MNEDSGDSDLSGAFQNSELVETIDDIEVLKSHKLWDIVRVRSRGCLPHILIGKEDDEDVRFWFQYHGETKADLKQYVEWKLMADKLSGEKKRSTDELDELRRVCVAFGVISQLLHDKDYDDVIMPSIISAIAKKWCAADNKDADSDPNVATAYCELVYNHVKYLSTVVFGVVGNMKDPESAPTFGDEK